MSYFTPDGFVKVNGEWERTMITLETRKNYDERHGGAFDRGSADSYYGRPRDPHFFVGATYSTERVGKEQMTTEEIQAYLAGYQWNEQYGDKKDWG
jgi:hypothetical protein